MNIEKQTIGRFDIDYSFIEKYELFAMDEIDQYLDGRIYPQIGYFDDYLKCLTIYERDKVLYRFNPLVVNACIIPLSQINGKVACFGLGNGYFAYMAHLKDEVSEVTIYELDDDLIEVFNKCMLPRFDHPDKVKIVKADPYLFLKNKTNKLQASYAFVNSWIDLRSGVKDYSKFKKLETIRPKIKYLYYLEQSILAFPKEVSDANN